LIDSIVIFNQALNMDLKWLMIWFIML
jgi:hypothetical protein